MMLLTECPSNNWYTVIRGDCCGLNEGDTIFFVNSPKNGKYHIIKDEYSIEDVGVFINKEDAEKIIITLLVL